MRSKESIGFIVYKERRRQKMTASELAKWARVHRNTISRMEAGDGISLDTLWAICKILNLSLDLLLEDPESVTTKPVQLYFQWPRPKRKNYGKALSSETNGRSDVLLSMPPGLGCERSGASQMPERKPAASDPGNGLLQLRKRARFG